MLQRLANHLNLTKVQKENLSFVSKLTFKTRQTCAQQFKYKKKHHLNLSLLWVKISCRNRTYVWNEYLKILFIKSQIYGINY